MSLACPSDPLPISISSDVCLTVVLFHVEAAYSIQAYGSSVLDLPMFFFLLFFIIWEGA